MTKEWCDCPRMKNETRAYLVCHAGSVSHNTFRSSFFTTFVTLEAFKRSTFHIQFIHNVYPQRLSRWKRLLLFQNAKGMMRFFQNDNGNVAILSE
jgi:hypothetical protein